MHATHGSLLAGSTWWRLGRDGWTRVLKRTGGAFVRDEVANLAAVVTLRLVLAIVPSLIAAVAIAAQLVSTDDIERLVDSADELVPGSAKEFVTTSLQTAITNLQENGGTALAISILVGLFAASGAAAALINALNKAYEIEEGRGFVGQRIASLVVVAALFLALVGVFAAIVLGPTILEAVLPAAVWDSPLRFLIAVGRYTAAVVVLMLFFGFVFWFGPNRDRPPARFLTPGAVVAVVGWLVLSFLFGLYVSVAGSYGATYGAFAGVIVLLIWLNYSFIVLLMGAELDNEIAQHLIARGSLAAPAPEIVPAGHVATGRAAGVGAAAGGEDVDRVDPGMPRHAGLMAAAAPVAGPIGSAVPRDGHADDQPGDAAAPRGSAGRYVPPPAMAGAAASTHGAAIAAMLWARMRR